MKETFEKQVINIAIPVALQSMLQSSFSMIDQIMVGQLGEKSISAVEIAGSMHDSGYHDIPVYWEEGQGVRGKKYLCKFSCNDADRNRVLFYLKDVSFAVYQAVY